MGLRGARTHAARRRAAIGLAGSTAGVGGATANACAFCVQLAQASDHALVEQRAAALTSFYRPVRASGARTQRLDRARVVIGVIPFDGGAQEPVDLITWGGPFPGDLDRRSLMEADDQQLRRLEASLAVIASDGERCLVLTGCGGPTSLYTASSPEATAWSTHAVAAAYLATGRADIDLARLPELLAMEFVGEERTLVSGTKAVDPATRIDISSDGYESRSYWSPLERWNLIPEQDAYATAEQVLLESLDDRLADCSAPFIGLTGGMDSSVVALALRTLGVQFEALTWAEEGWPDAVAAARLAAALEVPYRRQPVEWLDDDDALHRLDAAVRWNEGIAPASFAAQTWPDEVSAFITGIGGEIGRAYYYRYVNATRGMARARPRPTPDELAELMSGVARLDGARPDALDHLGQRIRSWLDDAASIAGEGWHCLDILYAEQRVGCWGRGMVPRMDAISVPAFATPELACALASLPFDERLNDGFHRRFLEGLPDSLQRELRILHGRSAVRARRFAATVPGAFRLTEMIRARRARRTSGLWPAHEMWATRPRMRRWLVDEVLGSELVAEGIGGAWAVRTREGFLADDWRATEKALLAAAPVALERALVDLNRG